MPRSARRAVPFPRGWAQGRAVPGVLRRAWGGSAVPRPLSEELRSGDQGFLLFFLLSLGCKQLLRRLGALGARPRIPGSRGGRPLRATAELRGCAAGVHLSEPPARSAASSGAGIALRRLCGAAAASSPAAPLLLQRGERRPSPCGVGFKPGEQEPGPRRRPFPSVKSLPLVSGGREIAEILSPAGSASRCSAAFAGDAELGAAAE